MTRLGIERKAIKRPFVSQQRSDAGRAGFNCFAEFGQNVKKLYVVRHFISGLAAPFRPVAGAKTVAAVTIGSPRRSARMRHPKRRDPGRSSPPGQQRRRSDWP